LNDAVENDTGDKPDEEKRRLFHFALCAILASNPRPVAVLPSLGRGQAALGK
jgi:hypothetical protein